MSVQTQKAGGVGRTARLVLGVVLVAVALPVYLTAGLTYNLESAGVTIALVVGYSALHLMFLRLKGLNRWVGAVIASAPVVLVWYFGQGGGPILGEGQGGTAAITFLAVSFLIDFWRSDSGCEVMALPGLIFGERTHLPCLLLCSIDHVDAT